MISMLNNPVQSTHYSQGYFQLGRYEGPDQDDSHSPQSLLLTESCFKAKMLLNSNRATQSFTRVVSPTIRITDFAQFYSMDYHVVDPKK